MTYLSLSKQSKGMFARPSDNLALGVTRPGTVTRHRFALRRLSSPTHRDLHHQRKGDYFVFFAHADLITVAVVGVRDGVGGC